MRSTWRISRMVVSVVPTVKFILLVYILLSVRIGSGSELAGVIQFVTVCLHSLPGFFPRTAQ